MKQGYDQTSSFDSVLPWADVRFANPGSRSQAISIIFTSTLQENSQPRLCGHCEIHAQGVLHRGEDGWGTNTATQAWKRVLLLFKVNSLRSAVAGSFSDSMHLTSNRKAKDYTYLYGAHVGEGTLTPHIHSAFAPNVTKRV